MRRVAARTDANQRQIIEVLRAQGCSVQPLHMVGSGCPDAIVGYRGLNFLIEIKDGNKSASRRRLTEDEAQWHSTWKGQVHTINSVEEAIGLITGTVELNNFVEVKNDRQEPRNSGT